MPKHYFRLCNDYTPRHPSHVYTKLSVYLDTIFSGINFEYDSFVKKSEVPKNISFHRYGCDAISRDLKLIVMLDDPRHYTDTAVGINDQMKDRWFHAVGYTVVRIPYYVQLTNDVVEDLFKIGTPVELCTIKNNFFRGGDEGINFNILPGNMSEIGRVRFIREFNSFSTEVRKMIYEDLAACCKYLLTCGYYTEDIIDRIIPPSVYKEMTLQDIASMLQMKRSDGQIIAESALLKDVYNPFKAVLGHREFYNVNANQVYTANQFYKPISRKDSIPYDNILTFLEYYKDQDIKAHGEIIFDYSNNKSTYCYLGVESTASLTEDLTANLRKLFDSQGLILAIDTSSEGWIAYGID